MKKLLVFVLALFLMAGVNSCKKYDDGPLLSLRSKTSRIVNDWVISRVENKGVDVTTNYPDDFMMSIKEDLTYILLANSVEQKGTWEFSEDKTTFSLTPETTGIANVYIIKRLKNKEFTFEQVVNNETSTFYMVQKPD